MKAEVREANEFKPITIEITIESEDELLEMYHRFILFPDDIKGTYCGIPSVPFPEKWCGYTEKYEIFDILDAEVDKLGLYND